MEMSDWGEDFSLGLDLGLDMFDQHNGQFGDLKFSGQPMSDRSLQANLDVLFSKQLGDSNQKDDLGPDWMESSDIDFFLNELSSPQDLTPETFIQVYECPNPEIFEEAVKDEKLSDFNCFEAHFLQESPPDAEVDVQTSLPSSPAQVAPVIAIDSTQAFYDCHTGSPDSYQNSLETTETSLESLSDQDLSIDDSEIVSINDPLDFLNAFSSTSNSCLTLPATPSSKKTGISIIHSSPELYKVISASAVESGKKHSSLGKSKCGKSSGPRKGKAPAQPVPEHVIVDQLNKKDRKKLQNKNAAIRYRQKKKEEAIEIKSEEQILEELNSKLKLKVEDLQREIKYMKNLMDDVRKAKGLL